MKKMASFTKKTAKICDIENYSKANKKILIAYDQTLKEIFWLLDTENLNNDKNDKKLKMQTLFKKG